MVKLYDKGVYLLNGTEIAEDARQVEQKTGQKISREEAVKQTMAYRILESHNTSGNMERLQIKFDKLTSHDIICRYYTDCESIRTGKISDSLCPD